MSTDTYGCTNTCDAEAQAAPQAVALLSYAVAESDEITATTSASLYAALQTAAGVAVEAYALEETVFDLVPPVAFTTAAGSIHAITKVKVSRFRGELVGFSAQSLREVGSPHVELFVHPINPDGTPRDPQRHGSGWWTDLDRKVSPSEIADLFPTAALGTPAPETCDDECLLGGLNIEGTVETIPVSVFNVHVSHEGLTAEDIQRAVEDGMKATRATHVGGSRVRYPEQ